MIDTTLSVEQIQDILGECDRERQELRQQHSEIGKKIRKVEARQEEAKNLLIQKLAQSAAKPKK